MLTGPPPKFHGTRDILDVATEVSFHPDSSEKSRWFDLADQALRIRYRLLACC
jgi:hypothetical protein